jgi:hypothetical protein
MGACIKFLGCFNSDGGITIFCGPLVLNVGNLFLSLLPIRPGKRALAIRFIILI